MGSSGVLARALPSVQVTWRLQAVPGTPSVPGIGALGPGGPTPIPTQYPPGPPSVFRDPPAQQHWQGPWLAPSASWVPPPASGLGFLGAQDSGGLAGGGHPCDPPSPGPGSGPRCQHTALATLSRPVSLLSFKPHPRVCFTDSRETGRRREGERHRCMSETSISHLPHPPRLGIDLPPRYVP